ncbi:complement C1q-like protein 2 [Perca flavescens]|uniref:complement C1q-like protein 2 n=1 Tax=Perca flavescens TaxID=8167 RepID=UPI00106EB82F|nr:complement C1q-like protein 2 [Perca flavescens]
MKISVSFMLLLLLGAVPPSESVECQRAFPEDIYAVLRETTASLVQLKADMTLQATGQAAQLKTEVDKLKQQLKEQSEQQKTEVDKLKQQTQVQQVAFSASLVVAGESRIGPVISDTTLIYKYVPTNIGNAYNSNTGLFTAPVRGAYHFEWHFAGDNSGGSAGWLVKNSQNVFAVYERQASGFMSASNGVTLLLEVGDIVFVRLAATSFVFDNLNHHTTFSGHLLFPI